MWRVLSTLEMPSNGACIPGNYNDVASHIVSDERLGEPGTNQETFDLLARAGWLDADLAATLRAAVGFRNVLVHGYAGVDVAIVRDIVENHLGDMLAFVAAIRARIPASA